MICPNCGKQLPDGARFCAGCGSPVGSSPAGGAGYAQPQQNRRTSTQQWQAAAGNAQTRQNVMQPQGNAYAARSNDYDIDDFFDEDEESSYAASTSRRTAQAAPNRSYPRQVAPAGNAQQANAGGRPTQAAPYGTNTANRQARYANPAQRSARPVNSAPRRAAAPTMAGQQARHAAGAGNALGGIVLPGGYTIPDIVTWVGALFIFISPFLTVAKSQFLGYKQTANYFVFGLEGGSDGAYFLVMAILFLILGIAIAILTFLHLRTPSLVCGSIVLLLGAFTWMIVASVAEHKSGVTTGPSMIVTVLGALAVIVGRIMARKTGGTRKNASRNRAQHARRVS